jgi:TPR repeat protein
MYEHGMGIDKDQEEALIYYAKSEEQGYNTFSWRKNLVDEIEALEEEEKIKLAEKLVKDRQLQIEFQRECELLEIDEKNLELYNISNRKKIERLTYVVKILREDLKWEDDDYDYINQDTLKRITNIEKVIKNLEEKEDEEGQTDLYRDLNAGGKEAVKRALMGYVDDQFLLGEVHYHGIGIEKNEEQAFKWFMDAAINEDTAAQYMVGKMYRDGQGIDKDLRQALKWFKKAARSDNAAAQYMVGMAYHRGEGIYKDREQAIKWITKASEQRYSKAREVLKKISA